MPATSSSAKATGEKPAVLIIGGLGYVGRFLALYLHNNNLASEVRIVDKQLPELARLSPEFKDACSRDKFIQADASNEKSLSRVFTRANTTSSFDYVFNCGGETRYSQEDEVYRVRSYNLALTLGRECARRKTPVLIECSTGMVYKPDDTPRKETDKLKPWLKESIWKLKAEEDLAKVEGLHLVILRLANVYGPYATKFMSTMLCLARVYQYLEDEMKWLWDKDLRQNTVHVADCARALWAAAEWYAKKTEQVPKPPRPPPVFNIVDRGNTSQGTFATHINRIFSIPTGFQGTIVSTFARMNLEKVVDDVNDDVLDPWAQMQEDAKLTPGPIGPFLEKELLKDNDLCLNGSRFEKEVGFKYEHEKVTEAEMRAVVESYRSVGWWP